MPMPTSASVIGSGALPVTVIAYANGPVAKPHAGQAMLCSSRAGCKQDCCLQCVLLKNQAIASVPFVATVAAVRVIDSLVSSALGGRRINLRCGLPWPEEHADQTRVHCARDHYHHCVVNHFHDGD